MLSASPRISKRIGEGDAPQRAGIPLNGSFRLGDGDRIESDALGEEHHLVEDVAVDERGVVAGPHGGLAEGAAVAHAEEHALAAVLILRSDAAADDAAGDENLRARGIELRQRDGLADVALEVVANGRMS